MIRTVHSGGVTLQYAVCNECREEGLCIGGVARADDAINCALPHGWTYDDTNRQRGKPVRIAFCPRCSVRPECREAQS